MLKKRLIPVLFLKNGLIVRSQGFEDFREFGNPINQLQRLNDWMADELVYIDITRSGIHDLKRDDHKIQVASDTLAILKEISKESFMPLTFGGRIQSIEDVARLIQNGADKIIVNTAAYRNPALIGEVADRFGSQACVVGIDVKRESDSGARSVWIAQGSERIGETAEEWAREVERRGAGEIFLNSIDRDGTANGFDLDIIDRVARAVKIPVIACGGAGSYEDFEEVFGSTAASAAAGGNIFNFKENAYVRAKKQLVSAGLSIRPHRQPIIAKVNS